MRLLPMRTKFYILHINFKVLFWFRKHTHTRRHTLSLNRKALKSNSTTYVQTNPIAEVILRAMGRIDHDKGPHLSGDPSESKEELVLV